MHSWAGHSHINFNYAYSAEEPAPKFPNVESHILARSTGALWLNESMSSDGTPRGYMVVEVDRGRRSVGTISLILMKMTYLRGWIAATRSVFTLPVPGTATDTSTPMSGTTTPAGGPSAIRTAAKAAPEMKRVTVYDGAFVRMADYYNSVQTTATFEPFRTTHMFRIRPRRGGCRRPSEHDGPFRRTLYGHRNMVTNLKI